MIWRKIVHMSFATFRCFCSFFVVLESREPFRYFHNGRSQSLFNPLPRTIAPALNLRK